MRPAAAWLASIILVSTGGVFADTPPSWSEFDVQSPNGYYLAEVRVKEKPEGAPRWAWRYQLTVFDTQQAARQPLWSCDFGHLGDGGGLLSDDGSTFVVFSWWYDAGAGVVYIYRRGKLSHVLAGREFNIQESKLVRTVSHQLWLSESESPNVRFIQTGTLPLRVEVTTIDGKTHLIDVESGKFVKP